MKTATTIIITPSPSTVSFENMSVKDLKPKPRKALNAYNIFYTLERHRIIAAHPSDPSASSLRPLYETVTLQDMERIRVENQTKPKRAHRKTTNGKLPFQEMNRIIAQRWKQVPSCVKKMFQEQAQQDRLEVDQKMEAWRAQETRMEKGQTKALRVVLDSPKHVSTAAPTSFSMMNQQWEPIEVSSLHQSLVVGPETLERSSSSTRSISPLMMTCNGPRGAIAEPCYSSSSPFVFGSNGLGEELRREEASFCPPPATLSCMMQGRDVLRLEPIIVDQDSTLMHPLDASTMESLFD